MRNIKVTVELAITVGDTPKVIADLGPFNTVLSAAAAAEVTRGRTLKELKGFWWTEGVSEYIRVRDDYNSSEWFEHAIDHAQATIHDHGVFLSVIPLFRVGVPVTMEIPTITDER